MHISQNEPFSIFKFIHSIGSKQYSHTYSHHKLGSTKCAHHAKIIYNSNWNHFLFLVAIYEIQSIYALLSILLNEWWLLAAGDSRTDICICTLYMILETQNGKVKTKLLSVTAIRFLFHSLHRWMPPEKKNWRPWKENSEFYRFKKKRNERHEKK